MKDKWFNKQWFFLQRTDQRSWKSSVKKTWSGPRPPLEITQRKMVCTASQDAQWLWPLLEYFNLQEEELFIKIIVAFKCYPRLSPMHIFLFYRFVHFLLCFNVILDSKHVQYMYFFFILPFQCNIIRNSVVVLLCQEMDAMWNMLCMSFTFSRAISR